MQPESYTSKLKNIQRQKLINDEYEKLFTSNTDIMNPPQFIIPEDFPEDVPLDEKFFKKVVAVNPWMFLHVWIQVEGVELPIQLFYRSPPYQDTILIHILFVGPPKGKEMGHCHCIKKSIHYSTTQKSATK